MELAQDSAVSEGWHQYFWVPSSGRKAGKGKFVQSLGTLGVAAAPASPGSAPNWPVSLPWVRRGVHSSDLSVNLGVAREKDSPWILKVQECGLEPRGPVPWT